MIFLKVLPAFIILLVLMILNIPVFASILASGLYLMVFVNHMPLTGMFNSMFEGVMASSLMAIPFFILAGCFISSSSLGQRLINCFTSILRNIRGGLPLACLVSNAVFGAISGSPPAATAVFSKVVHKPIAEAENDKMATGLVVSAAGLSSIIPPSVTMIIYGVATETSISKMFIAGILPGILIVVVIGIYLVLKSKKHEGGKRIDWHEVGKAWKKGIPVLILPVIILGGIYGGFVTPTEAGAFSAVYCCIISLIMRENSPKDILKVLKDGLFTVGQVYILIAVSAFFARALTASQFPQWLTSFFANFSQIQFLLILNVLLLIVGCFFDPSAAILILAPMLLPAALNLGIDPIHLGIVFVVNLVIGMFTPPFGLNIFVAQSVLKYDMKYISKCLVPYIVLYIVSLLVITYVPVISTWLPSLL